VGVDGSWGLMGVRNPLEAFCGSMAGGATQGRLRGALLATAGGDGEAVVTVTRPSAAKNRYQMWVFVMS